MQDFVNHAWVRIACSNHKLQLLHCASNHTALALLSAGPLDRHVPGIFMPLTVRAHVAWGRVI